MQLAALDPAFRSCVRLMVELLLLEGTKPLHRLLLGALKKMGGGKERQGMSSLHWQPGFCWIHSSLVLWHVANSFAHMFPENPTCLTGCVAT